MKNAVHEQSNLVKHVMQMLVKVTIPVKYVIEHINITLYLRKGVHIILWNVNHTDCELQTLISSHPVEQYLHCNSVNQLTEGLLTSVEQLVNNTSIAKWNVSNRRVSEHAGDL